MMENSSSFETVTYETKNQPTTIPTTLLQHYMSPKFIVFSIICVGDVRQSEAQLSCCLSATLS